MGEVRVRGGVLVCWCWYAAVLVLVRGDKGVVTRRSAVLVL
jgi:hypothetical protein